MEIQLKYILEYIEEFQEYIKDYTIQKFVDEMNTDEVKPYSLKFMIVQSIGGHTESINILILRHYLTVGVVSIKDGKIMRQEVNMDGIRIQKYLPKTNVDNHKAKRKEEKEYNSLSDEIGLDYNNKLTVKEKLDLLQKYVDEHPVIIEPVKEKRQYKKTDQYDNRRKFNGVNGRAYAKHKEYVDTIKHLPLDEYERLWKEYIAKNKYKKVYKKKK